MNREMRAKMNAVAKNLINTCVIPPLQTNNERELFNCLKDVIEDLELRAQVHKTLTGEEGVVPLSDGRYRKSKDIIAKFERVGD